MLRPGFRTLPITYQVDRARKQISTRCFGITTLDDVLQHFADLRAVQDLPEPLSVLLDLTDVVTAPERDQLRAVVGEIRALGSTLRWGALAIAARTDLLFGMSRILAVFVEPSFSNTSVFRRVEEAEGWLASRIDAS